MSGAYIEININLVDATDIDIEYQHKNQIIVRHENTTVSHHPVDVGQMMYLIALHSPEKRLDDLTDEKTEKIIQYLRR